MPNELITASSRELATELTAYDEKMLSVFEYLGLPTNNILVKVDERRRVFKNIEDVLEPYLIQQGFLQRTPRGRIATSLTYRHFGLQKPSE